MPHWKGYVKQKLTNFHLILLSVVFTSLCFRPESLALEKQKGGFLLTSYSTTKKDNPFSAVDNLKLLWIINAQTMSNLLRCTEAIAFNKSKPNIFIIKDTVVRFSTPLQLSFFVVQLGNNLFHILKDIFLSFILVSFFRLYSVYSINISNFMAVIT